jgi:hypothetical protein
MDPKVSALERAFQLARSGQAASIDDIKKRLKREGYEEKAVDGGPSLAGRHPKASTTKSLPPLTPLENNIRRFETSLKRLKCANSGHSPTARRTAQFDPELPFKAGLINGQKARESGLRLKASVAPRTDIRSTSRVSSEPFRTKDSQLFREERLEVGRLLLPAAGRYRVDRVACLRRGRCDLHISSMLRWVSRSSRRLDWMRLR